MSLPNYLTLSIFLAATVCALGLSRFALGHFSNERVWPRRLSHSLYEWSRVSIWIVIALAVIRTVADNFV
jgi:hypothetical protein